MLIAHKIALAPNNRQATYFARAAGVARFAYNWALAEWNRQYAAWQQDNSLAKPSQMALSRQLNAIKRKEFPWMLEVTKNAPQMAVIHLGKAFSNFFAGHARYPQFRKKGVHERFSLSNEQFRVDGSKIRIPRLGWVRMRESLRFAGKIMSATVSCSADRWFVSITVETPDTSFLPSAENHGVAGVDLGVSVLATVSDGQRIAGAKPHRKLLNRLKKLSRSMSRKKKGSKNRDKARRKLARLHQRIKNIRNDSLHKLTTYLTGRFHTVGIEDLNVRGMMKNHHLAQSVADAGFYEFRRQAEYKAAMRGGLIVVADRWFASSKLCSACGYKMKEMPLSLRHWHCPCCGVHHDRDLNAAINLKNYAASSVVSACGGESAGQAGNSLTKLSPMKQEVSSRSIQ